MYTTNLRCKTFIEHADYRTAPSSAESRLVSTTASAVPAAAQSQPVGRASVDQALLQPYQCVYVCRPGDSTPQKDASLLSPGADGARPGPGRVRCRPHAPPELPPVRRRAAAPRCRCRRRRAPLPPSTAAARPRLPSARRPCTAPVGRFIG